MNASLTELQRKVLQPTFYDRSPEIVAPELLGTYLVRIRDGHLLVGKIVEVEAYLPFDDPASHGYKPQSNRTQHLFGPAGHAYLYTLHRHILLNAVTQGPTYPGAVLIRAIEPVDGIAIMQKNRNTEHIYSLSSGPGKIGQAFALPLTLNGTDLTDSSGELFIASSKDAIPKENIIESPRIGVSKAKDVLLRFSIKDTLFLSAPIKAMSK